LIEYFPCLLFAVTGSFSDVNVSQTEKGAGFVKACTSPSHVVSLAWPSVWVL
jgi:hypothetical protein